MRVGENTPRGIVECLNKRMLEMIIIWFWILMVYIREVSKEVEFLFDELFYNRLTHVIYKEGRRERIKL